MGDGTQSNLPSFLISFAPHKFRYSIHQIPRVQKKKKKIELVSDRNNTLIIMSKRPVGSDDSLQPKRRKTTTTSSENPTTEPKSERHQILSSRDLHSLLAFDQDVGPVPRQSKNLQVLYFW